MLIVREEPGANARCWQRWMQNTIDVSWIFLINVCSPWAKLGWLTTNAWRWPKPGEVSNVRAVSISWIWNVYPLPLPASDKGRVRAVGLVSGQAGFDLCILFVLSWLALRTGRLGLWCIMMFDKVGKEPSFVTENQSSWSIKWRVELKPRASYLLWDPSREEEKSNAVQYGKGAKKAWWTMLLFRLDLNCKSKMEWKIFSPQRYSILWSPTQWLVTRRVNCLKLVGRSF